MSKDHDTNNKRDNPECDLNELHPTPSDLELLDSFLLCGETIIGHGVLSNHVTWEVLFVVI